MGELYRDIGIYHNISLSPEKYQLQHVIIVCVPYHNNNVPIPD